ncbi:MAG: sodium:calcium antiporter [Candidatus Altiarchaeota archaeon]|nr:sodium:calcium antiporter [Candidatus Altiarchaeota archaeon]
MFESLSLAIIGALHGIVGPGLACNILMFLISCFILVVSAELLVKSLTKIALYFRMSDFVVGFMIVALATSIPELFIGITSALEGDPELSVGNVIGANILDLTLIIGIITLLKRGIRVETKAVKTDTLYMFAISVMPLALMLDQRLDKFDGFLLLTAFFLYIVRLFSQQGRFREDCPIPVSHHEFVKNAAVACISIALLLSSADLLVRFASSLASDIFSPPILVGLFLLSIGTTLPELIFESSAILMRHKYMAFGDLIGSVIANNTLVLGVVVLLSASPVQPNFLLFLMSSFFMVVVAFLFTTFVEVEKHILWQEGVALIMLYVLFIIVVLNLRLLEVSYGMT